MALLLERHEVEGLLDMQGAIEATEAAFREQGEGQILSHAPIRLILENRSMRVVQGALLGSRLIGYRLGRASGFKKGTTIAVLCDSESGELLAVMSYTFGSVRTGATFGVATKYLARKDADNVAIIGTGRSAMDLLRGVVCVRPVKRIKVYSRDPSHRESFAEKAGSTLGVTVSPSSDPAEVIQGSDILLVATNSKAPVFDPATIEDGLHIASMGRPCEIDPAVYRRADLTVVGDEKQELNLDLTGGFTNPLQGLKEDKGFWVGVRELGDVVCGRAGRRSDREVTVFRDSQGGWGDLALAQRVLARAKEAGLGREVSF